MKCDSAERRQFLVLVLDVLVDPVFTAAFIWFKVQGLLHLIACSISKVWFSSHGVMPWWHHRVGWHSEEVWKSATVGERGIAERTWWAFCRKCGLLAPSSFAFCLFHFLSGPSLRGQIYVMGKWPQKCQIIWKYSSSCQPGKIRSLGESHIGRAQCSWRWCQWGRLSATESWVKIWTFSASITGFLASFFWTAGSSV